MKILVESLSSAPRARAPAPKAATRTAPKAAPKAATAKRAKAQPAVELAPPQIAEMAGISGLKFSRATHKSLKKGFTVTLQPELRAKANTLAQLLVAVKWPKRKPNIELAVSARSDLIVVNNDTARTVRVGPIAAVSYNAKSKIPRVIHVMIGERKTAVDLYDKASVERLFKAADSKLNKTTSTKAKAPVVKTPSDKLTAEQKAAVKAVADYRKFLQTKGYSGLGLLFTRGFENLDNLVSKGTLSQWSEGSAKLLLKSMSRMGGGPGAGAVPSVARAFKLRKAMSVALRNALGRP